MRTLFKEFSSSDLLIQARAYSLAGDAYVEISDLENEEEEYYQPQPTCN